MSGSSNFLEESCYSDVLPADVERSQSRQGFGELTGQVMAGRSGSGSIETD